MEIINGVVCFKDEEYEDEEYEDEEYEDEEYEDEEYEDEEYEDRPWYKDYECIDCIYFNECDKYGQANQTCEDFE